MPSPNPPWDVVTSRGAARGGLLSDHPCAGPEELESCLFEETLALVAEGGRPQGHLWVTARHAPYEQEGQQVRSCLLLQAGSKGLLDGVPYSCRLTGELGALEWDVAIPQAGMASWGQWCPYPGVHRALLPQGMCLCSWRRWSRSSTSAWR